MAEHMYTVNVAAGVSSQPGPTVKSAIDVHLRNILANDFEWLNYLTSMMSLEI